MNRISSCVKSILLGMIFILSLGYSENLQRPKIGLVLSGGGAMGFAHIGTLKLLDSLQIPVDYIAGTSMGGIAGALYAVGYSGNEIEDIVRSVNWQKTFTDRPPRYMLPYFQKQDAEKYQLELGIKDFLPLGPGGAIVGQNITLLFSRFVFDYLQVSDFDKLPIPFRCVAVDLITGNEVILKSGSLAKAMRSTMAVPSIFSPVEWGDSLLVDGGLLNNLPVDVVREMGANIVIASKVGNPHRNRQEIRNTLDVLSQSYNIYRDHTMESNIMETDVLIDCKLIGLGPADFVSNKVSLIIDAGERAAREKINEIVDLKEQYQLTDNEFCKECNLPEGDAVIGKIEISGNQIIPDIAIRQIVRIKENQYFNIDSLNECLEKLRGTGDYNWIRFTTDVISKDTIRVCILVSEKMNPVIYGINIYGNDTLPFDFIYRLFGIRPGDIFIHSKIEDRITYLYSLGYFEIIYYDVEPVLPNNIRFNLYVKESPEYKLRFGVRYDNYRKLVAAINLLVMNKPFPGLRIENELQFIGMNRFNMQAYYPSRTLDFPLYPFINFTYQDMQLYSYDLKGNKTASYIDRFTRAEGGLGLLYKNYWNVELGWNYERVNIHPDVAPDDPLEFPSWKAELLGLQLTTNIDRLDDTFIPRKGMLIHANYEKSLKNISAKSSYIRMDVSMDFYQTFRKRHTLHGYGFYGDVDMQSFTNKFFFQGGPDSYVGIEYNQLVATNVSLARLDYRYQLTNNLFVSAIGNMVFQYENKIQLPGVKPDPMWGWGAGAKLLTPLGPFELFISRGDKSVYQPGEKRTVLYFRGGYIF